MVFYGERYDKYNTLLNREFLYIEVYVKVQLY